MASVCSFVGTGSPGCFSAQCWVMASSVIIPFNCSTAPSLFSASTDVSWPQVQVIEYLFMPLILAGKIPVVNQAIL